MKIILELAHFDIGSALAVAIASVVGVLMFVLGLIGIFKGNTKACKIIAVIVCILSAAAFIMGALNLSFQTQMLVQALLAWIYFDCN